MLDLLIVVLSLALAAVGYAQGFIIGAASLVGLGLGGVVGTRVASKFLEASASSSDARTWAPVVGLALGLGIALIGSMAMQDLGARLKYRLHAPDGGGIDHALGALLMATVALILAWFAGAAVMGVPQLREVRPTLVRSKVLARLNALLPDPQPALGIIAAYDPFPAFDGGVIRTAAPDPRLARMPAVRTAARSVVRITGSACGFRVTGSGWIAAPRYIVTNAHVVGGERDTAVQLDGTGDTIPADIVHFDSRNDIAILRTRDLDRSPLTQVATYERNIGAVILGYPENRGLTSTPARSDTTRTVESDDIYGRGNVRRDVTSYRGVVRHGNSGGPVVDQQGRVLTTVFATTVGQTPPGGYGVPNALVSSALTQAQRVPDDKAVAPGPCVP